MKTKQGLFVIISSPTGGGKDTAIAELLKIFSNATRIVTTTSRTPRSSDKKGGTLNFVTREDFEQKIKDGYFLEYNNFADNYYGTPKEQLKKSLKKYDLIFSNIDVNGKHSMDKLGIKHLSIFLLPENLDILKKRAKARGDITQDMIDKRIKIAKQEIIQSKDYDYRIINYEGRFEETIHTIADVIKMALKNKDR